MALVSPNYPERMDSFLDREIVAPVSERKKHQQQQQVGPTPESNSILKCILCRKRFWVIKVSGPKKF